ncbi:MAG TPA: glycosyltransferase [Terriglobales bacterium]|nr:glycosyltransferase [Terriglobales bacterium]
MNSTALDQPISSPAGLSQHSIRVLHSVGHLLRGGIETWLYQVLQRLDPSHFEHHVLVRTDKKEPFTEDFQRAGFRVLPCLNYNNPVKYRANLRSIIRRNGPYDVLHVHGSNPNGLLALVFAKSLGIPATMVHSHNDVRPLLKSRGLPYRIYVELTLKGLKTFADRGFAVSNLAAESMFGMDWNKDPRWQLLQPGVDFKPFEQQSRSGLRESLGIPDGAFVIGHVGRFHEQKNHLFLLQVMEEIVKKYPQAQLLLVGDGPLRPNVVAEVERGNLREYVKFVPDTLSVPHFMLEAMDCFVLPSRYEGLGLVAVEAQAAGLFCVLSDRVPHEAVVDPKLVHFLKLDSAEQWAEVILQLRGTKLPATREHLQQFYASKFNLDRSAEALSATYEALAGQKTNQERRSEPAISRLG